MRVGIVSKWIASGQAIVARQLRWALDGLGHETFVLARPGAGPRAAAAGGAADRHDPAWGGPAITEASAHQVPLDEYLRWAEAEGLDAVLFDENYQFAEVAELRKRGVRTIGRFVWESFAPKHVEGALEAYDTVYSLTRCERERYRELGIESPYVQWGIHPELLEVSADRPPDGLVRFYFPGSFLGRRKPVRKAIKAFSAAAPDRLRLVISAQVRDREEALARAADRDARVELALEDEPEDAHRRCFAACDVCLAPSRWEGLGLPLFEAIAFGMPIVTNDRPPMSELVVDGESGILVRSERNGTASSGIPAWDPVVDDLTAAIERLADDGERAHLAAGARRLREERSWDRTVADLAKLVDPEPRSPRRWPS